VSDPINVSDTSARAVLTAIADLGEATAASIAESCGVAYSTTNKKLRLLEGAGLAEASRGGDTRVRWRLTDTGRAYANSLPGGQPTTWDGPQPATDAHAATDDPVNHTGPDTATSDDSPTGSGPADKDVPGAARTAAGGESGNPPTAPEPTTTSAAEVAAGGDPAGGSVACTPRRRKGALHQEVLSVLRQDPDATFTVTQLRKRVDTARHGGGQAAASAGAVYNALLKAVADSAASQVADKPATFQAVQPTPDRR
jgi:DNA-binding transcriptional ArsR family regulator